MNEDNIIKFKKLSENAEIPSYAHDGDIGMDIKCTRVEYDEEYDQYIYYTGIACETKKFRYVLGYPRSSNCKTEAYLTNSVGVIDSATYRGELQFRYKNRTSLETMIELEVLRRLCTNITHGILFTTYDLRKEVENEFITRAKNLEFAPYKVGERCAQIIPMKSDQFTVVEVDTLSDSVRGTNGFGSTGK